MTNTTTLMGRLCADPDIRVTRNGSSVANIRLAVQRDFPGANGEKQTDYFDVAAFKGLADVVANFLTKGRLIAVTGRMEPQEYTAKDGSKRRSMKLIAHNISFGDSRPDTPATGKRIRRAKATA